MICLSINAATTDEALKMMHESDADLAEVRLDFMQGCDLTRLIESRPCPVIITNRPAREGGKYKGEEIDRIAGLQWAIQHGADYVDIELDAVGSLGDRRATKIIVSHHNFERTPDNLLDTVRRMRDLGADVAKLAVTARSLHDNLKVFDLLDHSPLPTIGLCMGELGQISRILSPKFGGFLTFATPGTGEPTGPGQLTVAELKDLYNYDSIDRDTIVHGIIGNPVAHSMSPAIHNASFKERGLNRVYVAFKVDDAPTFIEAFKAIDVAGYSITIPHKQTALPCADELDPVARRIGAINTLVNRDGALFGCNTDWMAAVRGLAAALPEGNAALKSARVLLLGAGGAARAILFGLQEQGCRVTIANRTHERAQILADEAGVDCIPVADLAQVEADIIVNATSAGMHPNVDLTPAPAEILRPGMIVFDSVYNPVRTRLIREAEAAGCTTVTGVDMFVYQAVEQFELWTGVDAPVDTMRRVILDRLGA